MDFTQRFEAVPLNRHLGMRLLGMSEGASELGLPVKDWFSQEIGVVHGGIISTLADTAAVYSLLLSLGSDESMTGIEFKVNFLAAALVAGDELIASALVVKRGRRIAVADVVVRQGGKLVAKATFTFLVVTT